MVSWTQDPLCGCGWGTTYSRGKRCLAFENYANARKHSQPRVGPALTIYRFLRAPTGDFVAGRERPRWEATYFTAPMHMQTGDGTPFQNTAQRGQCTWAVRGREPASSERRSRPRTTCIAARNQHNFHTWFVQSHRHSQPLYVFTVQRLK